MLVDFIVSYLFLLPASSRPSTAPVMVPSAPSVRRSQVRVTSKSRAESWSFARRAWDRPGARIASSSEPPSAWSCPGAGMIRVRQEDSKKMANVEVMCLRWRCGEMKLLESRIMCAIDAFGGAVEVQRDAQERCLGGCWASIDHRGTSLQPLGPHFMPPHQEPQSKCQFEKWCFAFCNYSDY